MTFFGGFGYGSITAKLLNFEQKQRRIEVAQESVNEVSNDAELLKRIITGDET